MPLGVAPPPATGQRKSSMTKLTLRWSVAVLVTIAAFAAATWVSGALALTMRDAGVRWGIAGRLGVAVAALAALWGHSYATDEHQSDTAKAFSDPATAGTTNNKISWGIFHGPVIQSRDIGTPNLTRPAADKPAQTPHSASGYLPPEGRTGGR